MGQTITGTVTVPGPPQTAPTVALGTPAISGLTVTIGATAAATTQGASIAGFAWSWGDGSTSAGSPPQSHTYAAGGTYPISVTVTDSNGLTATATTAATVAATAPAGTVAEPARLGLAFGDFSPGNNSVMSAPVNLAGASAITIGVQISFEAGAQPDTLLNIGPLVVSVDTAGNLALSTQGAGGAGGLGVPYSSAYGVSVANAGSGWHNLLWVVPLGVTPTPANTQLWIDRQQFSLQQRTATPAITLGSETLYVSAPTSGTGHWDGYVANLFVWSRALSDAEAADWFDGYAPTTGLAAAWPMDDGSGTSAANLASGGVPLTWTGFNNPPSWV